MTFYLPVLEYFLSISISILLLYNFLTTLLFCFQKALWKAKKSVRVLQQLWLAIIFSVMMVYAINIESIPPKMFVIPWIWGFLASHVFIARKKRWLNELLGLGILLAITIVIYFKQADFVQQSTTKLYVLYLILGVIFGVVFWPRVRQEYLSQSF